MRATDKTAQPRLHISTGEAGRASRPFQLLNVACFRPVDLQIVRGRSGHHWRDEEFATADVDDRGRGARSPLHERDRRAEQFAVGRIIAPLDRKIIQIIGRYAGVVTGRERDGLNSDVRPGIRRGGVSDSDRRITDGHNGVAFDRAGARVVIEDPKQVAVMTCYSIGLDEVELEVTCASA